VDLSDDLLPPRRPLFFPVVIATVFLTIIGMSAGIAIASWRGGQNQDSQGQNITTPTAAGTTPSGDPCRPETQLIAPGFGAQGTLRIQLLLRTKTSAIWICADEAGHLFYHANSGGENAKWIENKTALFLANVQPDANGGYQVTATDGTTFSINSKRLLIVHKDGREENQPAYP
jgi:hypothetical protein